MKQLEKIARALNDEYRDALKEAMKESFQIEIETHYNLFSGLVSTRVDELEFTREQLAFMTAFERGYLYAILKVQEAV